MTAIWTLAVVLLMLGVVAILVCLNANRRDVE